MSDLLQKLLEERRIAQENSDDKSKEFAKKFIEDRTNEKLNMYRKSSLLCFGAFNQQFIPVVKDESNKEPY